jgi:hypothetical protein
LLYCPRYAALILSLLSVAAQIYGEGWYPLSDSQEPKIFLFGSTDLSIESNRCIFMHVQKYIKQTNRFSKNKFITSEPSIEPAFITFVVVFFLFLCNIRLLLLCILFNYLYCQIV